MNERAGEVTFEEITTTESISQDRNRYSSHSNETSRRAVFCVPKLMRAETIDTALVMKKKERKIHVRNIKQMPKMMKLPQM